MAFIQTQGTYVILLDFFSTICVRNTKERINKKEDTSYAYGLERERAEGVGVFGVLNYILDGLDPRFRHDHVHKGNWDWARA